MMTTVLPMPIRHMANSPAILQLPDSYYDMVRPGIMLYGVYPTSEIPHTLLFGLRSLGNHVLSISRSSILVIRSVTAPPGNLTTLFGWLPFRSVMEMGTSAACRTKPRFSSDGKKYPQVGRICMDQMMVNIEADSALQRG